LELHHVGLFGVATEAVMLDFPNSEPCATVRPGQ
jgi:hypothetical protein